MRVGPVSMNAHRRRVLPVVVWLQAGAAAAAMGLSIAGAPVSSADDGVSAVSTPSPGGSAQSGAPHRSGTRSRPAPATATVTGTRMSPRPVGPAASAAVTPNPTSDLPAGRLTDYLAGAATLVRRNNLVSNASAVTAPTATGQATTSPATTAADPSIRLAVFGDAGNSYTNGTNFYYTPGSYARYSLGASGPLQQAVVEMMRSWNPSDVFQLGDESYNAAHSTLLDYNIGQYYNNWIAPYVPPAYTQAGSIYTDGTIGGITATTGGRQWPYNLYDFPNGFPNPVDPSRPGGSADGVNHYFPVPGNHDEATILGTYSDANITQVRFNRGYNGKPNGADVYDYRNNIIKNPPYPLNGTPITSKTGSTQQLIDYHAFLADGNLGNLKAGSLTIGKMDPNGYGMYYGIDLGDAGDGRPMIHVTVIDTSRLLTDAGYYGFNFAPNDQNPARDPSTGLPATKLTKNPGYDVRNPLTASQAWFQDGPLTAPSIGRQMFLWAKTDLESSDAVWNIVMGHHPAYHVGNSQSPDDDSYTSNSVVLNFLQGLQDDTGGTLFDAYMNGHSHAYGRALEMLDSATGIGTGIPFFTIGDSGKVLDPLNIAPYGTNVLSPLNYSNFIGYNSAGKALYNYDINGSTVADATALAPYQAANPTTVGLSAYYSYSKYNWPVGTGYQAGVDPGKVTVVSQTVDPLTGTRKQFGLRSPAYLSYLRDSQGNIPEDLSGLYGFGSGAAQVDAGDGYLMMHYQTAQPIDPAIALIGRSQGITDFDSRSLFYQQWSPNSAKLNDLALFSFDVDSAGSLTNVQLVQGGNGYFEADPAGSSFLTVDQNFEILGNNPATPLGFDHSDPTRAVVKLSFSNGQLTNANLVNAGSDYQQVANAILECNNCGSSTVATQAKPDNKSLLVGVNIDLEAQYTLAASRPVDAAPYHDWYLITDTALGTRSAQAGGAFGTLKLGLTPSTQQAVDILATTPVTTGYTGKGLQRSFMAPQSGQLRLLDSAGQAVGSAVVKEGSAEVTLQQLPAPGALHVEFDGDAASSYQVNFRGIGLSDNVQLGLQYGSWTGPVDQQGSQLVVSTAQTMQVVRTDSGSGRVNFGLTDGSTSQVVLRGARGAARGVLTADELFLSDPSLNWQSSEGRAVGTEGAALIAAGSWRPTAYLNGRELTLASLQTDSNGVLARFEAGRAGDPSDDVTATFTLAGTGIATSSQVGVLTIRRLSGKANGLALYEADPLTGAVTDGAGTTWLPGQNGYLQAALADAHRLGLVLTPEDMPGFGQTAERTDLSLQLDRNYGALLLVGGSETDLLSSYAAANQRQTSQCLSLVAPGRGVSFSFEDLRPWQFSDRDFNDVIVTITPAAPTLSV